MRWFLLTTGLCLWCAHVSRASGEPLRFASPTTGDTLQGTVSLSVSAPNETNLVEYWIGSHRIGSGIAPSFQLAWNSAEAMDGTVAIQAVSYDNSGGQNGSAECVVTISNRRATVAVNAPNLDRTLSGVVDISVTGSDATAFPAVWTMNIDGQKQSTVWTDNAWQSPITVHFSLDTRRFANGQHELHISMNSRTGPAQPQWVNWRGMVNRVVSFDNGHQWTDVAPVFRAVYLKPGATANIGCRRLYADLSEAPCLDPIYTVNDSTVASVGAGGSVIGLQPGFTRVALQEGNISAEVDVLVQADLHEPHFGGDGEILRRYDPAKSLFVVAPFFLDPAFLNKDPSLLAAVNRAGINTLGYGFYINPWNAQASYSVWQGNFDANNAAKLQFAKENGFHLLLTGDDAVRRIGGDAWFTLNWPPAPQALQYAMGGLAKSGIAIGVEMVDEASMIWGPKPQPQGTIGFNGFESIQCVVGSCVADWTNNGFAQSRPFALRGASHPGLNTPPAKLYQVSSGIGGGFRFQAADPISGSFDPSTDPGLEFDFFATADCTNGIVCDPPVPNDALLRVRNWLTEVPHVPLSWPALAADSAAVHGNWIGKGSLSDYASQYFTSTKTRTTYPWSEGIQEMVSSMTTQFYDRQPLMMLDRPQLMLVSMAGPSYVKGNGAQALFQPATDVLDNPGVSPEHISALMMTAAALGGAGVRLYYFEPSGDWDSRAQAVPGAHLQTGANPSNIQVASWNAMGLAANLLCGVLEPYLFATALNAPAFGRNIVTAAREGDNGRMLLIVNGNDWPRTISVDLANLDYGNGATRYMLSSSRVRSGSVEGVSKETITLGQGESVAYIFPKSVAASLRGRRARQR